MQITVSNELFNKITNKLSRLVKSVNRFIKLNKDKLV